MPVLSPQLPPEVVLFDLDGTLTNSVPAITESFVKLVRQELGKEMPAQAFVKYVGPPLEEAMLDLEPNSDQARREYLVERYRKIYMPIAHDVPLYPGVRPMLDQLVAAGARLALATSKLEYSAKEVLKNCGILDLFETVSGNNLGVNSGLKEEVVAEAVRRLGFGHMLDAERGMSDDQTSPVVMVGDRFYDVEGAAQCGIPTVFCTWGGTGNAAEAKQAWVACDSVTDLPALLGYHS